MSDWKNVQYKDGKYKTGSGGGGGASALSDLTDVDLSNLEDGQIIKWDATTEKWVNANEGGGGGSTSITETSLWTASQQSTGDFTLSSSIDNFDFIAIWYGDWNERTQWRNYIIYSVNSLNANHSAGLKISVIGYSTRYNIIDISGTTLSIITNSSQAILEIKGLKLTSSGGGGGSSTFAGLDDVDFSNLQNGQVAKYNSTTQKWENANESGGGGSGHTYSATEQVIGTWIDGKPLYEITYDTGSINAGSNKIVNISGLSIDYVTQIFGCGYSSQYNQSLPLPFVHSQSIYSISVNTTASNSVLNANLQISTGSSVSLSKSSITIRYTKTTD